MRQKVYTHFRPFVVDIRDSPSHSTLQIEAKNEAEAKAIGDRFMKGDDTVAVVVVRRVKGFAHGKCMKWVRSRGGQWEEAAFYNQLEAGDKVPRLRTGQETLFGTV